MKSALKNHFGGDDDQKNRADERVQPEKSEIDPVQTAAARNPMFQHEAADDDEPADEIREAKPAQHAKRKQQSAHDHVREKRAGERIFLSPRDDERMQAVRFVELVILQRVNDVETDEPQNHSQRQYNRLHSDSH